MIMRTGLAPYYRDTTSNGPEKNLRGSYTATPTDNAATQENPPNSKATPPVEQTLEGVILDRRRQRQYSESVAHFSADPQSSNSRKTAYNSRALAAYQSNIQLAISHYQSADRRIDYFV